MDTWAKLEADLDDLEPREAVRRARVLLDVEGDAGPSDAARRVLAAMHGREPIRAYLASVVKHTDPRAYRAAANEVRARIDRSLH